MYDEHKLPQAFQTLMVVRIFFNSVFNYAFSSECVFLWYSWSCLSLSFSSFSFLSMRLILFLSSLTSESNSLQVSSNWFILMSISAFRYSACNALRMPYATELSYKVWNACIVILISSLTLTKRKPLSAQLMVTCLMSSSNAYEYSSSLIGHIPVSLAYRSCNFLSNSSCKFITSIRVAGVGETYCTHSCPASWYSRGGKIEFR